MELRVVLVGGALAVASRLWLPLFRVLSSVGVNINSSFFSVAGANAGASPRLAFSRTICALDLNAEAAEVSETGTLNVPVFCVLAPLYA